MFCMTAAVLRTRRVDDLHGHTVLISIHLTAESSLSLFWFTPPIYDNFTYGLLNEHFQELVGLVKVLLWCDSFYPIATVQ
jgi:hypothetical protein